MTQMTTTTKKSHTSAATETSTNPTHETRSTMPKKKIAPVTSPVIAADAAAPTSPIAPVAVVVTGPVQPPPKLRIPIPPEDFAPASPGEFSTIVPRQSELSSLPQALNDLKKFTTYSATLGATAPPLEEVRESITVGAQWSTMRESSNRWDSYASLQEGLAWRTIRAQLVSLTPAFDLAAKRDPKLTERYPGLAKLLSARQASAKKAASTRIANKKAEAEGKPQVHGKVGKRRLRKAEKESLAAAQSAAAVVATGTVTTASSAAQAAAPAPVVTAPAVANGGANGGTRS